MVTDRANRKTYREPANYSEVTWSVVGLVMGFLMGGLLPVVFAASALGFYQGVGVLTLIWVVLGGGALQLVRASRTSWGWPAIGFTSAVLVWVASVLISVEEYLSDPNYGG